MEALGLMREEIGNQRKEATNMAEKDEDQMNGDYKEMSKRMDKLEERMGNMEETMKNMDGEQKKANKALEAIEAANEAKRTDLVNKVVEAELLDEEAAKATPEAALQALLNSAKPKAAPAPGVFGAFNASAEGSGEANKGLATIDMTAKKEAS